MEEPIDNETKCAIYVRVSRDDQHCENQLRILREWAKAQGVEVFQEYVDHGVSGTKKSRPALDRMIADARRRYFKAILVWRFDRLGRSVAHMASLAEKLKAVGWTYSATKRSLDTTTPMGKAFFYFAAMFAEMERDAINESGAPEEPLKINSSNPRSHSVANKSRTRASSAISDCECSFHRQLAGLLSVYPSVTQSCARW